MEQAQQTKISKCIVCKKEEHHNEAIYCTRCGTKLTNEKPLLH